MQQVEQWCAVIGRCTSRSPGARRAAPISAEKAAFPFRVEGLGWLIRNNMVVSLNRGTPT